MFLASISSFVILCDNIPIVRQLERVIHKESDIENFI